MASGVKYNEGMEIFDVKIFFIQKKIILLLYEK